MKRTLDVITAAALLALLAPVFAAIALAVAVAMGRPVLYRQRRPGLGGKPFQILKFRTMTTDRDADGRELPDARRLTRLGRFLRRTSLDEVPELINVLKGEMSLVGPRPLLMEYIPLYTPRQARRHEVRPGLTGWAQVAGRNALTWEERFELDVWYVEHRRLALDLLILWRTVRLVGSGFGVSQPGHATCEPFRGVSQ